MLLPILLTLMTGEVAPEAAPPVKLVISADAVYSADGNFLEGGTVAIAGTKIAAVVPGGNSGEDGLHVAAITPGLVDLSPRIHAGDLSVEESDEVQTSLLAADSVDLFDKRWERLLKSGVTTVMVSPANENCIGGLTSVIKTGGAKRLKERTLSEGNMLAGAFGSQAARGNHPVYGRPTDFFSRRPTTRMGTEWVHRKAFYDTLAAMGDEERQFDGWEVMARVIEGELPYFVQASATQDIRTALYLKEEFQLPSMIIDAAAEVMREPEILKRAGASIVLPPFAAQGRTAIDNSFLPWNTARQLVDLEVPLALSAHGSAAPDNNLGMQAGYAMRGGLTLDEALRAVTLTPAELAGVADRVGTIEVGKDADLVLWSGTPFAATSRVIGVVLNGEVVFTKQ